MGLLPNTAWPSGGIWPGSKVRVGGKLRGHIRGKGGFRLKRPNRILAQGRPGSSDPKDVEWGKY